MTVHTIGHASVKRARRPDLIIKGYVAGYPDLGIVDSLMGMEIDLFII